MSALTFDGAAAASSPATQRSKADALRVAALGLLSIRFIQGFVYWGGGSSALPLRATSRARSLSQGCSSPCSSRTMP